MFENSILYQWMNCGLLDASSGGGGQCCIYAVIEN
jgi:hypothetical protein